MSFEFTEQEISGVKLIKSTKNVDTRGFLVEGFRKKDFIENGIDVDFVQENISYSNFKTLRGLHFQASKYAQDKLIYVMQGSILDVIVDLRIESKTFGKHLSYELDSENPTFLFVPKGFAHGFVTLSDYAVVNYKLSNYYNPNSNRGIIWNDETLNIDWKINFTPILSEKDSCLPSFLDIKKSEFEL